MNKKILIGGIIIAVVVVLIAIVATLLFLKSGTTADEETRKNAEELQQYMPDKTVDEIIEIGNQQSSDEEAKMFEELLTEYTNPEVGKVISTPDDQDLENGNPAIIYEDTEGNTVVWEISKEDWEMTDEEAEEQTRLLLDGLDDIVDEYEKEYNQENNSSGSSAQTPNPSETLAINQGSTYNEISEKGNDEDYKGVYNGFSTYEEYIADIHRQYPEYSIEQIKETFPDPAGIYVDQDGVNQDIKDGRLNGSDS